MNVVLLSTTGELGARREPKKAVNIRCREVYGKKSSRGNKAYFSEKTVRNSLLITLEELTAMIYAAHQLKIEKPQTTD